MKLEKIFCDNMILQADKPIRIYGESCGEVTVKIGENTAKAIPENGKLVKKINSCQNHLYVFHNNIVIKMS